MGYTKRKPMCYHPSKYMAHFYMCNINEKHMAHFLNNKLQTNQLNKSVNLEFNRSLLAYVLTQPNVMGIKTWILLQTSIFSLLSDSEFHIHLQIYTFLCLNQWAISLNSFICPLGSRTLKFCNVFFFPTHYCSVFFIFATIDDWQFDKFNRELFIIVILVHLFLAFMFQINELIFGGFRSLRLLGFIYGFDVHSYSLIWWKQLLVFSFHWFFNCYSLICWTLAIVNRLTHARNRWTTIDA